MCGILRPVLGFARYVILFLLEELVNDDGKTIRPFHPFADFSTSAAPRRTVTNTSSIYRLATLSPRHASAGTTNAFKGGSHDKPEFHLVAAPPAVRNGRPRSKLAASDGRLFSVFVIPGRPKRQQTTGSVGPGRN
jgi:hypothetical protein